MLLTKVSKLIILLYLSCVKKDNNNNNKITVVIDVCVLIHFNRIFKNEIILTAQKLRNQFRFNSDFCFIKYKGTINLAEYR